MADTSNYFSRLQRGEADPPAISTTLGGRILSFDAEAGTLESEYVGTEAFLNPAGQVQGGIQSAMLDDVTAFLVQAMAKDNEFCATLTITVSFLRPAMPGLLLGRSRLMRRGRDIYHVAGELLQDGKLVSTAVATCMLMRR